MGTDFDNSPFHPTWARRVVAVRLLGVQILSMCDPLKVTSQVVLDLLLLSQFLKISSRFCFLSLFRELSRNRKTSDNIEQR